MVLKLKDGRVQDKESYEKEFIRKIAADMI